MTDPQDLVSIYQATNVTEAHMVKNLLIDEGIDAQVSEENEPLAGLPIAQCDVLVRVSDQQQAETIVGEYEQSLIERAERPDWTCPSCKAIVIGAFDECDNCGAMRPGLEIDAEE
jgi:hypothetical protein